MDKYKLGCGQANEIADMMAHEGADRARFGTCAWKFCEVADKLGIDARAIEANSEEILNTVRLNKSVDSCEIVDWKAFLMKLHKIQIRDRKGDVLFEHECEGNTIRATVEMAVRKRVSLEGAILSYADLREANLSGAKMSGAILISARLKGATLAFADLKGADCKWAILEGANLTGANLSQACFRSASLENTLLCDADMGNADISNAFLREAVLTNAVLAGACMMYADLRDSLARNTDFTGADLKGALLAGIRMEGCDLSAAHNTGLAIAMTRICPEGLIIGYELLEGNIMAKLAIPTDAQRSNAFGRKCRAEKAIVSALYDAVTGAAASAGRSMDSGIEYKPGKILKSARKFEQDFTREHVEGEIHFYLTEEEAKSVW
jgi:uncharacterized protein YjbI with pentapeptide repeats